MRTSLVRRMARRRAFTLVELMVSLVAGLIVTIAVVGLARTATTTFYEEARLSTTEAAVRSAAERLRQDLSRTAFMSTGNIQLARNDSPSVPFGQKIAHPPGSGKPSRYGALTANLQGIKIVSGGSLATGANGPLSLSDVNLLTPDTLQLTGNFTTNDAYRGRMSGTNSVVVKVIDDPAVARLVAGVDPNAAVRNIFTPGSPSGAMPPFLARVVDARGCAHFVVINGIAASAAGATFTFDTTTGDGKSPVLTPTEDQSTCGASDQEEVTINPIHTVRWYIGQTSAPLAADPNVDPAGNKFDLYRQIVDASGAAVTPLGGPQVVAEYAVDLKFGITVDDPASAFPPPQNHRIFDMDTQSALVQTWTADASGTVAGGAAPQRVRSVRFRLATRAAMYDRVDPLPTILPTPPQYMARYCLESTTPCKKFARVRTIMSEAALINQAGMTY